MTIVDAHHHLWDLADRPYPWLDAPALAPIRRSYRVGDLRRHADAVRVSATVLVQTLPDLSETRDLLAVAQGSGGLVRGVVGWVDLTDPHVGRALEQLRAGPGGELLVGIRHQAQDEPDPEWLIRPAVLRGLRAVAAAGLVFDLLVLPHQLAAATAAVAAVPDGRYVLDHAGKPGIRSGQLDPWAVGLRRLAAHPSVACKLSGLVTEADWRTWRTADLRPYAEAALEAFGPDRVMAGSDWPVCELAASYARVWAITHELISALSPSERADVLGGVAARVYGLADRHRWATQSH